VKTVHIIAGANLYPAAFRTATTSKAQPRRQTAFPSALN